MEMDLTKRVKCWSSVVCAAVDDIILFISEEIASILISHAFCLLDFS